MKRLAILFLTVLCFALQGQAQTYTQHIQQKQPGKGSVTVTQSKEIDDLVNGKNKAMTQKVDPTTQKGNQTAGVSKKAGNAKPVASTKNNAGQKKSQQDTDQNISQPKPSSQDVSNAERQRALEKEREKAAAEKAAEERRRAEIQKQENEEEEINIPTVDMRKKVMRNARKVTGYRVQAYAGGNTRADKQRAQQIGEAIKLRYPGQPIYVHFYSPRWICRVGNYRSYSEASKMLHAIKSMGYRGATIVKGKITVFE